MLWRLAIPALAGLLVILSCCTTLFLPAARMSEFQHLTLA